jgi:hypothetical protein
MHTGGQGAHLKTSKNLGHKKQQNIKIKNLKMTVHLWFHFQYISKLLKTGFSLFVFFIFYLPVFHLFCDTSIGLGITCQLCINLARKKHK